MENGDGTVTNLNAGGLWGGGSPVTLSTIGALAGTVGLTVTDQNHGVTPQAMATALVGGGVAVSNVTFTGSPLAGGTFSQGAAIVGIPTGIVLSSGKVQTIEGDPACSRGIEGPNNCYEVSGPSGYSNTTAFNTPGDADLDALSGFQTFDATILEFDFVPQFSTIQFKYVFSSEEYSDYANTQYNDVFGFFINGQNCALVPDTAEPISVNTINNGNDTGGDPTPHNPELFIDNVRPNPSVDTEMDGLIVVLTCSADVEVGQTNHMKLATSDASDAVLDSAVFIEAGSLVSVPCGNGTCEDSEGETCGNCPEDCGSCCGNGICDSGESSANCPDDCIPPCGNGTCESSESCNDCPADCGLCFCGNGTCDPLETCTDCASDCGPCNQCGDGICDEGETCSDCPADCGACPAFCGDGTCDEGETCSDCPADCGECPAFCGDGTCDEGETCSDCPADCGECPAFCGDGICDEGETCSDCPADCGECPAFCGDGTCDEGETCSDCPADCGICAQCTAFPCGKGGQKQLLCHVPPGNLTNPITICIDQHAIPAHLANHPDYCGPCPQ